MARVPGVQDGIMTCTDCGGPMVKVADEYRCMEKVPAEELVAVGFLPDMDSSGKVLFRSTAKDQQFLQATQAYSGSVEIDNSHLEKLGLNLDKIREYQLKHSLVP